MNLQSDQFISNRYMTSRSIEERLKVLESRVSQLQAQFAAHDRTATKDWRRAIEKYAGDSDLQAIFSDAMKLREKDRGQVRRRTARSGSARRKSR
jgi:hypothetical protein